ncbi:unnamed protein product [Thlaspi arvense]|uniref:Glycoside hydrolase family 38 central domain-containing protein n=1 Tax=Thlaspi arvense TaxID=13288 RepID=A0AAU9S735_THLAR|nr:unnamed protein product [Thlaspi arvense]
MVWIFTSRPALKRYVRVMSAYYLAARQLEFFKGRNVLAIAQHHDAISATSKQHVADDYAKRQTIGDVEAIYQIVVSILAGWKRVDIVRLPVSRSSSCSWKGHEVESQLIPFTDEYAALRNYHVETYLGHTPTQMPKYWLVFWVFVPPAKKTGGYSSK